MMNLNMVKTKEEARQIAIDWQYKQNKQAISYEELLQWQKYFKILAKKFNLTNEFKENGII